ncbi:DNA repair protein RecO [Bacteroidales bacterium OttesenSCG-928-I14]|nr:DNA repair protein RecO [Bacteroidales bacterium OttesenSCG-928-I14]
MLHKTRGIVLHSTNYNDSYSIVRIFTEEFGITSYFVSKSKGKKSKGIQSFLHPLAILDMEVEHYNLRDIHKIKEVKNILPLNSIFCNPIKSSVCLFLSEFLSKVIKEIQADKLLFNYIIQSLEILDLTEKGYSNFHLVFMIRISQFLGFYPDASEYRKGSFFDMLNGNFATYKPNHPNFLNPDESEVFALLLRMSYDNMHSFQLSRNQRHDIINRVLEYYSLHLISFSEIKSLDILHEVFD